MTVRQSRQFRVQQETGLFVALNRVLLVVLILAVAVIGLCLFLREARKVQQIKAEGDALAAEVERQEESLHSQRERLRLLKSDPEYLELFARDRLDLMKEGESIFRVESK